MIKVLHRNIPANLKAHAAIMERHGIDGAQLFSAEAIPAGERFLRSYAAPLMGSMPDPVKMALTDFMKSVRNPGGGLNLRYPSEFSENQVILDDVIALNARPWRGKRAAVCLCHDVDNQFGYDNLKAMLELDTAFKVPATYFFLTHDAYQWEPELLRKIRRSGSEIALHGDTHDQGLAFRPALDYRLAKAMDALKEFDIQGFRSPALSVSPALFAGLKNLGLKYDSSLQIASPFYNSVRLPYPVYLQEYDLWEIPLMIQDDNYFRDTRTPDGTALASIGRFLQEVIQLNGVFVLNCHPHLMAARWDFYGKLLALLRSSNEVLFTTMKDIVDIVSERPA